MPFRITCAPHFNGVGPHCKLKWITEMLADPLVHLILIGVHGIISTESTIAC